LTKLEPGSFMMDWLAEYYPCLFISFVNFSSEFRWSSKGNPLANVEHGPGEHSWMGMWDRIPLSSSSCSCWLEMSESRYEFGNWGRLRQASSKFVELNFKKYSVGL